MKKYIFAVAAIAIFLLAQSFGYATTYYFSTSGSDANNGLSSGTPKQSISAAVTLMTSGNTILFKRGDVWYIPFDSVNLSGKSNVTLNAYGTGDKPVIAGMALLDGTWTYTGSANIWKSVDPRFNFVHRIFVNGVSRISLDNKKGNINALSNLDSLDEYFYDETSGSRALYIKTTSSTVAPTGVEVIPSKGGYWQGARTLYMKNASNITIKNIEFRGGSSPILACIEAPSSNITIDSCIIGRCSKGGIIAGTFANNADVVQNLKITNSVIDKGWTLAENNIKDNLILQGDGIAFHNGVNAGAIRGNIIRNFGHEAIGLFDHSGYASSYGVKNVIVEMNDVAAGNSAYMHAFSIISTAGKAMYNIVKRNYFHHFQSGCTIGGEVNFVFANIFSTITASPILQHKQSPWGGNVATWDFESRQLVSKNNWIVNNTFYMTDAYSILLARSTTDTTSLWGNKIMNNVFMNFGRDTTYPSDSGVPPPRVGLRIENNVPAGQTLIHKNNFWDRDDTTATKQVAKYRNSFYTATGLNLCAECGGGNVTGNMQLNPRFDSFFGLTPYSSPTLQTGGFKYSTNIIAWGLNPTEYVDYFGTPWPTDLSIGAVQY